MAGNNDWYMQQWEKDASQQWGLLGLDPSQGEPAPKAQPLAKKTKSSPSEPTVQSESPPAKSSSSAMRLNESGFPLVEPTTDSYAEKNKEMGGGIRPTFWEKFWSQSSLALHDAPIGIGAPISEDDPGAALFRMADQTRVGLEARNAGSLKLTPEQANKQFPGLEKPFTEDVYPEVARLIYDEQQRVHRQQAWVNRGPQTGAIFDFAAGSAAGLDPFNLVVGSMLPEIKGLGMAKTLAYRYAGNFAANLAGEVPGLIQDSSEQKAPRTVGEVLGGVAAGAAIGTGIHTMLDLAFKRGAEVVAEKSKGLQEQAGNAAITQHENGKAIDTTPTAVIQAVRDAGHTTPPPFPTGEPGYQFRKLAHPSETHYHVAIDPETGAIKHMEDLGGGIVAVDNPAVANNAAGVPESAFNGKVVTAALAKDANLVDAEMTLKDFFQSGREKALEKMQGILGIDDRRLEGYRDRFRKLWTEGGTVRDFFNMFQAAATDRIRAYNDIPANDFRKLLDGMGYDGIQFNGKLGDTPIDNRIIVFNHEKLSPVEINDAVKSEVPQFTPEQQKGLSEQAMAPENDRFHEPEAQKIVEEKGLMNDQKVDVPKIEERFTAEEENARKTLEEMSRLPQNEGALEAIDQIDADYEADMHAVEAAKNLAMCIGKGIA